VTLREVSRGAEAVIRCARKRVVCPAGQICWMGWMGTTLAV